MTAPAVPLPSDVKSTTVRADYARVPPWVRAVFRAGSRVLPDVAARAAEHVFFRPHRRSRQDPGAPMTGTLRIAGHDVAAYGWGAAWGLGRPAVLLVHGWEGSAAQMAPLAGVLATAGHRVVAVDLPAHGRSSGHHTSLPEVARILRGVVDDVGPVRAMVGHSFGAVAVMVAAFEMDAAPQAGTAAACAFEGVVTMGAPAALDFVVASFAAALGLGDPAYGYFRSRLERRFDRDMWRRYSPQQLASGIHAAGLVIHDQDDATVPIAQARALQAAWPGARLVETCGFGHYHLLRAPPAHAAIVRFLGDSRE